MSLPAAYLAQKLTQPLPTKGGAVLRTIACTSNHMLALPPEHAESCNRWRRAATLIIEQADVAAVIPARCASLVACQAAAHHGPWLYIQKRSGSGLLARQEAKIDRFVSRITVAARASRKVTFVDALAQRSNRK
jgi:hypothetical protein